MSMSPLLNLGRTKLARGQVDTLYARVELLETHLRRVLEAGKHLRVCLDVVNFATYRLEATCRLEIANFDQAVSDAEGVLHG